MKIYVNDSEKIVSENYNLQSLLEEMKLSDLNGWAVAINKEIIHGRCFIVFTLR